ncbi:helix-turn-helix domain-containing protein [Kitasatospora sp. NPDC059327]|uniref:helix-turn-helix domain-containing protein n=1 Tax=Kitasatospora sp. NPDC059327 TaxID=3346803 RepID=UPI0036BB3F23
MIAKPGTRRPGSSGGDAAWLQRLNTTAVLRALHDMPVATITELAKAAGVSRPTTEDALGTLVTQGLAAEVQPEPATTRPVGRPAKRFEFNQFLNGAIIILALIVSRFASGEKQD